MPNKENEAGKISRRAFLGGAAALGGVLGAGALTAAASPDPLGTPITGVTNDASGFELPKKYVDEPTYTQDIVGPITRMDVRDTVFNRSDLKKGTEEFKEYYSKHPEYEKYHEIITAPKKPHNYGLANTALGSAAMASGRPLADAVDGPVAPEKVKMTPEQAAEKIKGFCKALGAALVGIGPCKDEWLYSHNSEGEPINLSYKYQISIACPQDYDLTACGNGPAESLAVGIKYSHMALISCTVADYIRSLGYPARANHYRNYAGLCVPMAIDAGLGELGRHGFLITKEFGTNVRLANILTDMPMELDKPVDLGVQDFCGKCLLCGEWCPSGSICMGEKVEVRGIKKWALDPNTCYNFWNTNDEGGGCALCMVNCPWSKPPSWIHSMAVESATHSSIARSLLPRMEKVVYGKWVNRKAPDWMLNTVNQ